MKNFWDYILAVMVGILVFMFLYFVILNFEAKAQTTGFYMVNNIFQTDISKSLEKECIPEVTNESFRQIMYLEPIESQINKIVDINDLVERSL